MRGKLVVGNWKMNGGLAANAALLAEIAAGWKPSLGRDLAVCVPYPYLPQAQGVLVRTPIAWGAQDVSEHDAGAYTGEVSARMLVDFGCRFAIEEPSRWESRETDCAKHWATVRTSGSD